MLLAIERKNTTETEHTSEEVFLFRGLRNNDSDMVGNWWAEDAFYALSVAGPNGRLVMMRISRIFLTQKLETGGAISQTYRGRNKIESEIEFTDKFPGELVELTDTK